MTTEYMDLHEEDDPSMARRDSSTAVFWKVYAAFALVHAFSLGYQAVWNSPTWNEKSHLAAGVSHWEFQRFDLFRVNPPLVRTWAAIPVVLLPHEENWRSYSLSPVTRREASVGQAFAEANGPEYFRLMTCARWMCIPFSLFGGWICGRWAMQLYGLSSGILAMLLWFFSPMVLGHASLITADAHSAALGVAAMYAVWSWLSAPNRESAVLAGVVLGLGLLAKHTLLVLYPVTCVLAVVFKTGKVPQRPKYQQIAFVLLASLFVVNFGYLLEDSFKPLKDYRFQSELLTGLETGGVPEGGAASRLQGTHLDRLPVPVPANYLQGIDTQRVDFEGPVGPSYLCGTWQERGWWYWYVCAFSFKTPVGTLALLALAVGVSLFAKWSNAPWRDELCVWFPALAVIGLVSSQTGFTIHYRYMMPALPFLFIGISKVARAFVVQRKKLAVIVGVLAITLFMESLWAFPHSLSFFNGAVGGPPKGPEYLVDSNTDWGQDLFYLRSWQEAHPEAEPLRVLAPKAMTAAELWGVPFETIQQDSRDLEPGWYAVSVNCLQQDPNSAGGRNRLPAKLLNLEPVANAGYSIRIYRVAESEEGCALQEE
jgi:hypothetical protein